MGDIGWTRAHLVVYIAAPDTQEVWVAKAGRTSSREFERSMRAVRAVVMADAQRPRDLRGGTGAGGGPSLLEASLTLRGDMPRISPRIAAGKGPPAAVRTRGRQQAGPGDRGAGGDGRRR